MFKIGDKVRRLSHGGEYPKSNIYVGRVYTVTEFNSPFIRLKEASGRWYPRFFKLVTPEGGKTGFAKFITEKGL